MKPRHAELFRRGTVEEKLYHVWYNLIDRCTSHAHPAYSRYGKRGIKVCDEWKSFKVFLEWARKDYKNDLWLDRKDNNGNYEPDNCRWVTAAESRNNVQGTKWLTAFGETKTISEWIKDPRCKVRHDTLAARIKYGYEPEESITTPTRGLK